MTADERGYAASLGAVLRQRSVAALRAFLEAQAGRYGDERQVEAIRIQSDAEIEHLLHRMTLARPDLTPLHAESRRWLAAQGAATDAPGVDAPDTRPPGRGTRRPGRPRRNPPGAP